MTSRLVGERAQPSNVGMDQERCQQRPGLDGLISVSRCADGLERAPHFVHPTIPDRPSTGNVHLWGLEWGQKQGQLARAVMNRDYGCCGLHSGAKLALVESPRS